MKPDELVAVEDAILPYLDATLSHAAQTALLGLVMGLAEAELACLPGLANRKRRRAAVAELTDRGFVQRSSDA